MKLKEAVKIAKECGLETIGETYNNIAIHAMNLFEYSKIMYEIEELIRDIDKYELRPTDTIREWERKHESSEEG